MKQFFTLILHVVNESPIKKTESVCWFRFPTLSPRHVLFPGESTRIVNGVRENSYQRLRGGEWNGTFRNRIKKKLERIAVAILDKNFQDFQLSLFRFLIKS